MDDTLGGLFAFVIFGLIYLPTVFLAVAGWWTGRRLAFQTLTQRFVVRLLVGLVIVGVALWCWHEAPYSAFRSGAMTLSDLILGLAAGLFEVFAIVAIFAAMGWAANLDDFWAARRARKEAKRFEHGHEQDG